jgi:hypothetical protein
VQVLFVHLALVFPQRRRILENNPQLLRWLYLTPLLTFVGFPTFGMLSLPMRVLQRSVVEFLALGPCDCDVSSEVLDLRRLEARA